MATNDRSTQAPPDARAGAATALGRLRIDRTAPPVRRRRWAIWLLPLLAAAAVAAWFAVPRAVPVKVVSVVTSTPSQQYAELTASGYVVAQRRAAVASKATGRLVWLGVREGSVVRQDEVIARIDASDVQAQVAAAQAAIAQAQANVQQAQVELANARAELGRAQELVGRGFISPQAADTARARVGKAEAGLALSRASVAQARASLRVQQVAQESTEIRAPFDGVVLIKNANVGDMITPFSQAANSQGAVVTMADMGTLEVEADVSESNVAKVRPDQPVEIVLDAIPDTRFRGTVGRIVPTVDRAKATVMTKIRFERLDARVLPEMSAKVTFLSKPATEADQKPVLAVNPRTVVERDGARVVLRVVDRSVTLTLEQVPVSTGRSLGDVVEVSGALKSGDRLVLEPAERLGAGQKVEVAGR